MTDLLGYLLLFVVVGVGFILVHLLVGKLIRPAKPDPEKLTIYECGEPTIGSAWVQFDLRFYVVALLFVIFDVEVVFFFPWAVVFGKANALAKADTALNKQLDDLAKAPEGERREEILREARRLDAQRQEIMGQLVPRTTSKADERSSPDQPSRPKDDASGLAWMAFWDIAVFFGVLLVGFAYLWKRGDLDWVRSTAAEQAMAAGTTRTIG